MPSNSSTNLESASVAKSCKRGSLQPLFKAFDFLHNHVVAESSEKSCDSENETLFEEAEIIFKIFDFALSQVYFIHEFLVYKILNFL